METQHIIDAPLAPQQDFKFLKKEAIGFLQDHVGHEWTNFNPSDPGVTILDQVCYGLTELGYCIDFDIQDILTDQNGELAFKDQFYRPEDLLTTAPITADDYIKYIIDQMPSVENMQITRDEAVSSLIRKIYQVRLKLNPNLTADDAQKVCTAAYYNLNASRNLGDCFQKPEPFTGIECLVSGCITIAPANEPHLVLIQVQEAVQNFVFPSLAGQPFVGSAQRTVDEAVFDGPRLKNGMIPSDLLVAKKNTVRIIDLIPVIGAVTGVVAVSITSLQQNGAAVPFLQSSEDQLLCIDVIRSCEKALFDIVCQGNPFSPDPQLLANYDPVNRAPNPPVDSRGFFHESNVPKGKFRDINTYFSIQNTFPAVYGVGQDVVQAQHSSEAKAYAKQLKGYLTLFDQILANMFSQLANVSRLFSFRNQDCGTPSDDAAFNAVKSQYEKDHPLYPAPYRVFSPSYYYQSLYATPHIRPLLKHNGIFDFEDNGSTHHEQRWNDFKSDPYNTYIFGLMRLMDDPEVNYPRRNRMLNHLLARHGESPALVDALISGSQHTGDPDKDRLIFKSMYLQNLGHISYYRYKSYNVLAADQLGATDNAPKTLPLPTDAQVRALNQHNYDILSAHIATPTLDQRDFQNFSTFELKLDLLFGLKRQYGNYIVSHFLNGQIDTAVRAQVGQAFWFMEKRCGIILIETGLLLQRLLSAAGRDATEMPPDATLLGQHIGQTDLLLVFPDFIPQFQGVEFRNRLSLFLDDNLPADLTCLPIYLGSLALEEVIPNFIAWHDSMRIAVNDPVGSGLQLNQRECAQKLGETIIKYTPSHV